MHINTYSGYESGKTIIVQGNYVVLQFSSGPWRITFRNLGFRILFTAVPFGKYNTTSVAERVSPLLLDNSERIRALTMIAFEVHNMK